MRDLKFDYRVQVDFLRKNAILPEATIADLETNLSKVAGVIMEYHEGFDKAKKSGDSTPQGLLKRRQSLATEASRKLQVIETSISGLDENIRQTEAAMKPKEPPAEDRVIRYLREQEIRQEYRGKDALEIELTYRTLAAKNPLVASALENSPQPLLKPDVVAKVRAERARLENPEAAQRLDQLQTLKSTYTYCFNIARQELPTADDPELKML